jgi:hypothetical protein
VWKFCGGTPLAEDLVSRKSGAESQQWLPVALSLRQPLPLSSRLPSFEG